MGEEIYLVLSKIRRYILYLQPLCEVPFGFCNILSSYLAKDNLVLGAAFSQEES